LFAEDSGIEVDALDGAPGVWSARFAGEHATDAENNRLLIERLRNKANRSARYVCVIALARDGLLLKTFRGEVEGLIVDKPAGSNGFGYDPHFLYPPFRATFAELEPARKFGVSHRGRAFRAMIEFLRQFPAGLSGG
jgi:XTP/dITP diphosphohydrolase